MLLTNVALPDITDNAQTHLFDWEDYEIAGRLGKLEETIQTREGFELARSNLTTESNRTEVERVLGCSSRQANRFLQKLRGGKTRVPIRDQILFLLASGRQRTVSSIIVVLDKSPQAIGSILKQLLDEGEIIRVRRGVYSLSTSKSN